MRVLVRKAQPTDCRFLAQVMYDSMVPGVGHGVFDFALEGTGVDPLTFHETLLRVGANNWGPLGSFFVLDTSDQPQAGAMGAFLSEVADLRPLTGQGFKVVSEALGWSQVVGREFLRKYITLFGAFGNAPQLAQPAQYVLEYVAIHPELRGMGLFGELLREHTKCARSLGCRTIGITTMSGNERALRAYLKAGFREHTRYGSEYYRGVFPGLARLVKDI
jgi:ribosomal protein S18 acetylase RimI-like enzyme